MTVSTNSGSATAITFNVKQSKALFGSVALNIVIGSTLRRRVGNTQQEDRHIVAFGSREHAEFSFVVSIGFAYPVHGGGEATINKIQRRCSRVVDVAVRWHMAICVRRIYAAIRVAGNAVPVIGFCVSQSANRHSDSRLDLIATGDDRGRKYPHQLIGVTVRVTTGTGERSCG